MAAKKIDLKKRLKLAFKNWGEEKEEVKKGGFDEFDDGRYFARLVKTEVTVSSNGRLQVAMHWKFLKGEYKGKTKIAYQGIETEENRKYFGIDLNKLGYETDEIDSADDIEGILKELNKEKPKVKISLKTNGEFQNVRILAVQGSDDEEEAEEEEAEEEDGDDDSSEEDDEEKPKKKAKKKASDDDDEDESEDEDDSDDEDEEEEKPKKKKKKATSEEDEDESDDDDDSSDDDDDDEDEKPKKKKKKSSDDDDDEEEEEESDDDDDGEDVEISVGSEIKYKFKGKRYEGTVLEVLSKSNELRVETDDKKRKISLDNVTDVTVPEKPKKKIIKKKK